MPIQSKSRDLVPLMRAASRAAAAARERGDWPEYERQKELLESLSALYRGFGTTEDALVLERLQQSPMQQIAKAGKWVAIGAGALLLLPYLMQLRK